MKRRIAQWAIPAALAILTAAFVAIVIRDRGSLERPPEAAAPPESRGTPEEVFRKVSPCVVTVEVYGREGGLPSAQGSGVVVATGTVVTNRHVVESGGGIRVHDGERSHEASVLHADREYDLCSLAVPSLPAPPVGMASVRTLRAGQRVYAVGAPRGLERTISSGLVSAIRPFGEFPLIQTDASVSPGSSGGGLFDTDGRLVGITTFTSMEGQNLNFALVSDLVPLLPDRGADIGTLPPVVPIRNPEQIVDKELLDGLRDGRLEIDAAQAGLQALEEEIERQGAFLNDMRLAMDASLAAGDGKAYNEAVPEYNRLNGRRNELVSAHGRKLQEYRSLVERQNRLAERHNRGGRAR